MLFKCNKKYLLKSLLGISITVILIEVFIYFHYSEKFSLKRSENNLRNELVDYRQVDNDGLAKSFQDNPIKAHIQDVQECSSHLNFAYIKTHKTGSSTVYGVFLKYVKKHGLKLGQKNPNPFLGGYPGRIKEELIFTLGSNQTLRPVTKGEDFVLIDHFRFEHTVMKKMMPKQTLFISVVRDPWRNFQSAFHYHYTEPRARYMQRATCFHYPFFHIAKGQTISFSDYIHLAAEELDESIPWYFRSKNYQSHDLGLDPLLDNDVEIEKAVRQLGSQIDLMMITDYMDESMILLKKQLCMSWTDLLYSNVGESRHYKPQFFGHNTTVMKDFRKIYKLDIAMYDYFNATFWNKVDAYGRAQMGEDIETLKALRIQHLNQQKVNPHDEIVRKNISPAVEKFNRMMYEKIHKNLDQESMTEILQKKILKEDSRLDVQQVKFIAEYMIQNKGGCPM